MASTIKRSAGGARIAPGRAAAARPRAGAASALLVFTAIGTLTAVWPNPFFARSTPLQGFELVLLAVQSLLIGLYVALRRPAGCASRRAGLGGALSFLGVACPTCNKVLLLLFGANALLEHFEPARLYLGLAGVLLTAAALYAELRPKRQ